MYRNMVKKTSKQQALERTGSELDNILKWKISYGQWGLL
jgi:hypothetical protein